MEEFTNMLDEYLLKQQVETMLLLQMGQLPKVTANTLLAYAYSQKSVVRCNLTFDRDLDNNMQSPKIIYDIEIKEKIRYGIAKWALNKGGFFGKLLCLVMIRLGAPMSLQEYVRGLASSILPAPYKVEVRIRTIPLTALPMPADLAPVDLNGKDLL